MGLSTRKAACLTADKPLSSFAGIPRAMVGWEVVDVSICFYPVAVQPQLTTMQASPVPLLVHLGAEDALCGPEAQQQIKEFVEGTKGNRVIIHEKVGHGFARWGRTGTAATAAESAELTSIEFLDRHLAGER
jgi:carboxymethylenebutenolidase